MLGKHSTTDLYPSSYPVYFLCSKIQFVLVQLAPCITRLSSYSIHLLLVSFWDEALPCAHAGLQLLSTASFFALGRCFCLSLGTSSSFCKNAFSLTQPVSISLVLASKGQLKHQLFRELPWPACLMIPCTPRSSVLCAHLTVCVSCTLLCRHSFSCLNLVTHFLSVFSSCL